ncbi:DUF2254 domain-containing protein [Methylocystis bryophila]|uniref:DNA methylase n=1 Tax=Methylocystis bryophila TaxID=655015 RepID=A0A1W6MQL2_9HYPH|nr:DUF2254 domain-containing protein [Methylocystis bryophila]ARN79878.1 DNA methylase [Methylocystis bryophila]BDV39770.1 hypothetical protein DSM21852_30230 [Methylocystis bryophila]
MIQTLSPPLRATLYALRGGFLVRPLAIVLTLGLAGAMVSDVEERLPAIRTLVPGILFPSRADPQVAQAILTVIATSTMTVVSIVFAILLMTLTLASTQFSPRILVSFVRDRVTQWTLGVFLGTFSYCIAALPAARSLPTPFAPVLTVLGAMLLAPVCVGMLVFFIFHISNAISVNNIVDRLRRETELVIDELMPERRRPGQPRESIGMFSGELHEAIASRESGYIRFVDIPRLRTLAKEYRICLRLERRVGHFIPEGVALIRFTRGDRITDERALQLLSAIEIGPTRTMQQDVEFGVVQIVDIALRAISPAVNDPTTAISCVDQLSSILIRWIEREPPRGYYYDPPHILRIAVPWIDVNGLLDLAFEQIRHYAVADAGVSLRLMRALGDIAGTVIDPAIRRILIERGRQLLSGCTGKLHAGDLERLSRRLSLLESGHAVANEPGD